MGLARRRVSNVVAKEWRVMSTSLNNGLFVTLLPLLIVAQALLAVWVVPQLAAGGLLASAMIQSALTKLEAAVPAVGAVTPEERLLVFLLHQFTFYVLLIPVIIAVGFATFNIVEEKQAGSLEPLLATPVRTWELLLGKTLAGAIPALVVTWASAGLFLAGMAGLGWGHLFSLVLTPPWFMSLFLLTPAVAVMSFMLGVVGSSRFNDAKTAQNVSAVIVLPVLAIIGVQVTGLVWFGTALTVALALGILLGTLATLWAGVRLFQREAIVVQWR